ncbi:MBL fold metallo-hydrolase [Haloferax sp. DFSO52]|uniref:MBL fold metallo-hydrolase n=1 Tax=Haloferax sp. DFSO52 TaxID=3388505 RepID=UPI003A86B066
MSVQIYEGDDTVLFATGFAAGVDPLIAHLQERGGLDVIVVEHTDPDHFDALEPLLDAFDAKVAVPAVEADILREKGYPVDVELEDGDVRWGVRCILVPGHTPGNMSFLVEESDTLIVGDTFVHKNSFASAPGEWSGEFAPIKPGLNADDAAARENVIILADYDFDVALMTHGLDVFENARDELDALIDDLGLQ